MGMLDSPEIEAPQRELRRLRQEFEERTGLEARRILHHALSAGHQRPRHAHHRLRRSRPAGPVDLSWPWHSGFRPGHFDAEYRHSIGDLPASALGRQVGTLQGTTHGFNDRGMVIRNFHYIQRLWDGKFGFLIGRADPSDLGGGHAMQNVNTMFVNRAFASASTVAFPGFGFSAGFSLRPVKWYYATVGASNAYGNTIMNDIPSAGAG